MKLLPSFYQIELKNKPEFAKGIHKAKILFDGIGWRETLIVNKKIVLMPTEFKNIRILSLMF